MFFLKKKIIVVTHSGTFHADDVFACATISLWAEKNNLRLEIIRNRDKQIIEKAENIRIWTPLRFEISSKKMSFNLTHP
jgi:uncharacterized UPF0160 family protein